MVFLTSDQIRNLPEGTDIVSGCCSAPPSDTPEFCSNCHEHTGYEAVDANGNVLGEIDPIDLH
jgi:hypothetical protein